MQPVENLSNDKNSSIRFNNIKWIENELKWIKLLQTASSLGLNDNFYHEENISKMPDFDVVSLLEFRKHKSRYHCKRQKRKRCARIKYNASLNDLSTKLREHGRHAMLSLFSPLPIPVLCIFSIEARHGVNYFEK